MSRLLNMAESISALTCELNEEMTKTPKHERPYHMFNGFSGWWSFCAEAGMEFHRSTPRSYFTGEGPGEWIELVWIVRYSIWSHITIKKTVPTMEDVRAMVRAAHDALKENAKANKKAGRR